MPSRVDRSGRRKLKIILVIEEKVANRWNTDVMRG
jgi:hypothetical protein